jgi:hypothetical protein
MGQKLEYEEQLSIDAWDDDFLFSYGTHSTSPSFKFVELLKQKSCEQP